MNLGERMQEQVDANNSSTAPKAMPTDRDVQRNALRDLVALAMESAATESQIEQKHQAGVEQIEKEFKRGNAEAEHRLKGLKESIEQKYQERLTRSEQQHAQDMKGVRASEEASRKRIEHEYSTIERDTKQKYEQAAWLAESLYDGTQAQVAEERKKAKEELGERFNLLEDLENQTINLLTHYRMRKPEGMEAAPTKEYAGEQANEVHKSEMETAQRHLAELRGLFLPHLFTGLRPALWVIVIGMAATGGTYAVIGQSKPPTTLAAVAGGITLVLSAVLGIVLKSTAKKQVREVYARLRASLDEARTAAARHVEHLKSVHEAMLAEAAGKKDEEIKATKEKLAPLITQAAKRRDTARQMFQAESARQAGALEERRVKQKGEIEESRKRHLAEAEGRYAQELAAVTQRHEKRVEENERSYREARSGLEQRLHDGLEGIGAPVGGGVQGLRWDDPAWEGWTPPKAFASQVRFGELTVDLREFAQAAASGNGHPKLELPSAFSVPLSLALPKQASLVIHADDLEGRSEGIAAIQMIMTRLLTSLPAGRVRFTLFDPVGLGQNFAGFMHLADHDEALVGGRIWTDREQIAQRLADLTDHMETVIQKYLRNEFETIDDYNAQAGELAEPYRFLVIADFPVGFEPESLRRLASIASTGARCGVYMLILHDTRQELPSGTTMADIEAEAVNLVQKGDAFAWRDEVFEQFPLKLDSPPTEQVLTKILDVVGRHAKEAKRVEVNFDTIAPSEAQMWSMSSAEELRVPVGRMGATRLQALRLGKGVAQHVLIAGKTGSGKSTLLHALVTNLAMWYSPDEVEFYLVDFKKGVEFKTYATHQLPHARAIAVESDREFGLSVLQRLDGELTRRGDLFRRLGVQDLAAYRAMEGSGFRVQGSADTTLNPEPRTLNPLPRTLLIIDEFQEFFSEDDKLAQDAAVLLDRLVRQGRAFGIHVLLGSQTIGGTSGLSRSTIGQMAVRIALQTSEADSQLILGDGNSAARLLTRPGEAIYNDAGGLVEANSPFQVAWLADERRDRYLERVTALEAARPMKHPEAVVFEGNAPGEIERNARLRALLEKGAAAARTDAPAGPPACWIGDPVAIKEPTAIVLRRQSGANALIIGQQDEAAMAIMISSMVSLASQLRPEKARFVVMDGTPADSPLVGVFARAAQALPHEVKMVEYRAMGDAINELADEVKRRQSSEQGGEASIYVFIYAIQRYRGLRKSEDDFSFSSGGEEKGPDPSKQFAEILKEGPAVGVHVITWADTPVSVERTFDRNAMREFDNRILFQMSANDSSNLIDSPAANRLGFHRALAFSEEQGVMEKFRPYAIPPAHWLDWVGQRLRGD